MTKLEFVVRYAKASYMSVVEFREIGGHAVKCDCGSMICQGWTACFLTGCDHDRSIGP